MTERNFRKPETPGEHPLTAYRRRHNDMTMAELGRRAGFSRTKMMRIEAGIRPMTAELIRTLVAATDNEVSADDLVNWVAPGDCSEAA